MAHSDSHKTIENFFNETRRISQLLPVDEPSIECSPILSILRPYQFETVKWMVMRELQSTHIQLDDMEVDLPLGGILADEMGLGKTVELLACILGHCKEKKNQNLNETKSSSLETDATKSKENENISSASEDESMSVDDPDYVPSTPHKLEKTPVQSACFLESSRQRLKKRGNSDYSDSPILAKRPALSSIKVNRTMRQKIKDLLKDYFEKFQRFYKRKHLNEGISVSLMDISFKIILLNRFYNFIKHTYSKQQTWGYLLTEFNVDDTKSIGYSILEKEMGEKCKTKGQLAENPSNEDCLRIIVHIDEFLTEKMMTKFEKDFNNILAYSLYMAPGDDIPLSDGNDVKCQCGSDKAQGKKIECPKCNTFQHLQCVGLDHKFEDFNNYTCPYCWMKKDMIESSATLIVIPCTLALQWKHEIKKHAVNCNLKVCIYGGVSKDYVLPDTLAAFDIVIVSFETLRLELNYASEVVEKNTRSLRHNKRYLPFASPLTCISWWRLCIDEAQIVESSHKVNEMVSHLKSTYRWAVTGTPIGKSLKDLHGLTSFLGIEPFTQSYKHFQKLLVGNQTLLHTLFAYIMRRKTKNEVSQQLNLPDLKVDVTWLSFTPIEGYFYQYTHSITEKTFLQKMKNVKDIDQHLSKACRRTTESVLTPLLSLRQACVHPQAVNKKNIINLSKTMRMEELLEQMIKKTKTECEDILRLYIMNINGAAGVKIYMAQFVEAVSLYRMVLSKMKEFQHLTIDSFQVMHAKHNLYETALKDESIELTPEEQNIPEQVNDLEQKYIDRRREPVIVLLQNIEKHSKEIENYLQDFHLSSFDWWEKMFNRLDFDEMKTRIFAELDKMNLTLDRINVLLSTGHRLSNALQYWLSEVEDKRMLTYTFLDQITKITPIATLCKSAEECHLRQTTSKKSCLLCKMESTMTKYENLLFNGKKRAQKGGNDNEDLNPLNWNISAYECILTAILSYAKSMLIANNDVKRAADHLKVLSLLKREFKTVRATWTKQCDLVHGYDEVAMAKSRFDAVSGSTDKLNHQNPLFQSQFETYEAESIIAYSRLQSTNGSVHYLMNLRSRYSDQGVTNECCPVCQVSADERRGVMSCGHFTCYICMLTLIKHSTSDKRIQCPVCRTIVLIKNITYVHGGGTANPDMGDVRGNYSVKIIAVTAKVLRLKQEDPKVKILIFSTWDRVLDVTEQAFKENEIKFQRFYSGQKQKQAVESFKKNEDINALLIPLRSGSKGLNLTEASHIIFTEPVLSVADEKQAIGRIYRLGQSKNMVVHKFLIKSTIEQHLFEMNEQLQKSNAEGSELTFRHLKELFIATTNDIETECT